MQKLAWILLWILGYKFYSSTYIDISGRFWFIVLSELKNTHTVGRIAHHFAGRNQTCPTKLGVHITVTGKVKKKKITPLFVVRCLHVSILCLIIAYSFFKWKTTRLFSVAKFGSMRDTSASLAAPKLTSWRLDILL